jgi:dCMP deaminase
MNWSDYFFNIAEQVKLKSKDLNTQIGAVIVGRGNEIVSTGYNSFPRGLDDKKPERQERPEKYFWFEHAERNAIYNAARIGVSTEGCEIYLTCYLPCADCARALINSGIKKVHCKTHGGTKNPGWDESLKRSKIMLQECGVEVVEYKATGKYLHENVIAHTSEITPASNFPKLSTKRLCNCPSAEFCRSSQLEEAVVCKETIINLPRL